MCRAFKVDVVGFLSPLRGWLYFPLHTHGLRPFDRLRASCGLRSSAASRLVFGGTPLGFRELRLGFGGRPLLAFRGLRLGFGGPRLELRGLRLGFGGTRLEFGGTRLEFCETRVEFGGLGLEFLSK